MKALFDTLRTWEGKDSDVSTEHVSVIQKKVKFLLILQIILLMLSFLVA